MFQGTGDTIVYIKGNSTGDYDEVGCYTRIVIKMKFGLWEPMRKLDLYFAASTDYHISGDERKVAFTRAGYRYWNF